MLNKIYGDCKMHRPLLKIGISPKIVLGNIITIVNGVVWHYYASAILKKAIDEIFPDYNT